MKRLILLCAFLLLGFFAYLISINRVFLSNVEPDTNGPSEKSVNPLEYPDLNNQTPIFIKLFQNDSLNAKLNGKSFSAEGAQTWLTDTKERFGGEDPVILVCDGDVPINTLLFWYRLVTLTHKKVWMTVRYKTEEEFLLIAVAPLAEQDSSKTLKVVLDGFEPTPLQPSKMKTINRPNEEYLRELEEAIKKNYK